MSFDESTTKTTTLLPWDRFQNWLHCVCVVTFDLELGQAMEVNIPQDGAEYFPEWSRTPGTERTAAFRKIDQKVYHTTPLKY